MPVDDSRAGPVWMLTFPLARERCRCACGKGARLRAPVVVAGRRARVSRPRPAALDHQFGIPRVRVHVPSLPRRRVRSSRPRTATSGESGVFHRTDIVAAATAGAAGFCYRTCWTASLRKKGGQRSSAQASRPAPMGGDGRRDRRAVGGYAPSRSRSARSDSARWVASWTVVSSASSNMNVSR